MKKTSALLTLMIALTGTAACGTSSDATAPAAVAPSATSSSYTTSAYATTQGMEWWSPVTSALSASAYVTPTNGGVIRLDAVGATLTIPAGAVSAPTTITMTALPGRVVAFEFAPAGTSFKRPLTMNVSLRSTKWTGSAFNVLYFKNAADIDNSTKDVKYAEVLPVTINLGTARYDIWHFSGYALSSSRY